MAEKFYITVQKPVSYTHLLIMEYLGGGGHSTVAGAQVKDKNVDMVIEDVEKAVFDYVANNES